MLTASDLHAEYGDNTIFEGLSLTLSGSRRVGLVGPNGAGKTTLLRLLAGVDAPRRGAVALGPGDRIGYLPQEPPGADLTIDRLLGAALGEVWRLHGELDALGELLERQAALAAGQPQTRDRRVAIGVRDAQLRRLAHAEHANHGARRLQYGQPHTVAQLFRSTARPAAFSQPRALSSSA
jgi:ATPase subunit of ABC transporter with duplicated ATPase domains